MVELGVGEVFRLDLLVQELGGADNHAATGKIEAELCQLANLNSLFVYDFLVVQLPYLGSLGKPCGL